MSLESRRLYIIEGVVTVVWAGMCYFLIPSSFETAYFLNEDDKVIMRRRAQIAAEYSGGSGHYTMKDIKQATLDPKTWIHGVIQIFVVTILYGNYYAVCSGYSPTMLINWNMQDSELSYLLS